MYAKFDADPRRLLADLHANHVHAVAGDWLDELEMFARIAGIDYVGL